MKTTESGWLGKLNSDFGMQFCGRKNTRMAWFITFPASGLPEFDIEIDRMLREYRARPGKVQLIEKIRNRVEELRGHWVYWS